MTKSKIEIQDHNGNVYHPHSSADVVFTTDGKTVQQEITDLKSSVSNGKSLIAAAITDKGVAANSGDTYQAMANKIGQITTGPDTQDATATAASILVGQTAYIKGTKITGTIPSKAAATITPGTANKTIAAGQYLSGAQTIAGSANLVAGNIKQGINIFGVIGTLEQGSPVPDGLTLHFWDKYDLSSREIYLLGNLLSTSSIEGATISVRGYDWIINTPNTIGIDKLTGILKGEKISDETILNGGYRGRYIQNKTKPELGIFKIDSVYDDRGTARYTNYYRPYKSTEPAKGANKIGEVYSTEVGCYPEDGLAADGDVWYTYRISVTY